MKHKTKSSIMHWVGGLLLIGMLMLFLSPVREVPGYYVYDVPDNSFFSGCGYVTLWCEAGSCPYGIENGTASGIYNVHPATFDYNIFGWELGVSTLTCL